MMKRCRRLRSGAEHSTCRFDINFTVFQKAEHKTINPQRSKTFSRHAQTLDLVGVCFESLTLAQHHSARTVNGPSDLRDQLVRRRQSASLKISYDFKPVSAALLRFHGIRN